MRHDSAGAWGGILVFLALFLSLGSSADASSGALVAALRARQARIDAILSAHPGKLRAAERESLEDALAGALDFGVMARAALADWDTRSAAERTEYADAFERLIRRSLMRRVDIYRIESVDYGPEGIQGDRGRVDTVVRSKDVTTEVRWDFVRTAAGWRVSDYAIDGVSTVRNYRRQFARLLDTRGWDGLIERIRKRTAELEAEIEKEM